MTIRSGLKQYEIEKVYQLLRISQSLIAFETLKFWVRGYAITPIYSTHGKWLVPRISFFGFLYLEADP